MADDPQLVWSFRVEIGERVRYYRTEQSGRFRHQPAYHGNDGMKAGSCPNRAESSPMSKSTISLVLQDYFHTNSNQSAACVDNFATLISMTNGCYQAAGKQWPNFIAVDFYQVNATFVRCPRALTSTAGLIILQWQRNISSSRQ